MTDTIITVDELRRLGAEPGCEDLRRFVEVFPDGAALTPGNLRRAIDRGVPAWWLLARLDLAWARADAHAEVRREAAEADAAAGRDVAWARAHADAGVRHVAARADHDAGRDLAWARADADDGVRCVAAWAALAGVQR